MSKILYHPNIEFKDEDYQWLIRASLFWDNIYRIVPENYTPKDKDNIKILSEDGDLVKKITVKRYDPELDKLRFISSYEFCQDYWDIIETFNSDNPDWRKNTTRFNMSKADHDFIEKLDRLGLVEKPLPDLWQVEWVRIPKFIGDRYMSYFARHIAESNKMSLATPDSASWLAASNLLQDHGWGERIEELVFPVSINDIIPENLDISPKKILEFREKRKDERRRFNEQCERFSNKLLHVSSIEVFKDIWNDECKEIEAAIADYKKSMDILNATKFVGGLSLIASIVGNALGYADFSLANTITGSVCLGLNVVTAILNKVAPNANSAYSYLYDVHRLAPRDFRSETIRPKRI